LASVGAASY